MSRHSVRNSEATVFVGNIDEQADPELLYELLIQTGPLKDIFMPRDKVNGQYLGYAFAEYASVQDAEYTIKVLNQIRLFGKPLKLHIAGWNRKEAVSTGADLYISGLDPLVDEKVLYDTFIVFGNFIKPPMVMRDENGVSKGYGFLFYDNFDSADRAIAEMDSQILMNKFVKLSYSFKKDGSGERHGDQAERLLAEYAKRHNYNLTNDRSIAQQPIDVPTLAPPGVAPPKVTPPGFNVNVPPPGLR